MLKIWLIYNLVIASLVFGTSISSAHSLTNYLLPLLILPLIYYLGKEVLRKSKKRKLQDPTVFATDLSKTSDSPALEGEVMEGGISDDNRRLFLKQLARLVCQL
jgi:hypothetical protein